jgi:hypothetical protein
MGEDAFEPKITTIVRRYSEKVTEDMPDATLAQSLGTWEEAERRKDNEDTDWQSWLQFNVPAR